MYTCVVSAFATSVLIMSAFVVSITNAIATSAFVTSWFVVSAVVNAFAMNAMPDYSGVLREGGDFHIGRNHRKVVQAPSAPAIGRTFPFEALW